jgi:hypothetical protein
MTPYLSAVFDVDGCEAERVLPAPKECGSRTRRRFLRKHPPLPFSLLIALFRGRTRGPMIAFLGPPNPPRKLEGEGDAPVVAVLVESDREKARRVHPGPQRGESRTPPGFSPANRHFRGSREGQRSPSWTPMAGNQRRSPHCWWWGRPMPRSVNASRVSEARPLDPGQRSITLISS